MGGWVLIGFVTGLPHTPYTYTLHTCHARTHTRAHTCTRAHMHARTPAHTHRKMRTTKPPAAPYVLMRCIHTTQVRRPSVSSPLSLSLSRSLSCVCVCVRALSPSSAILKSMTVFFFLGACVTLLCGHCFHTKCVRDSEKHDLKLKGYFLCPECREVIVIVGIVRTSSKGDCD